MSSINKNERNLKTQIDMLKFINELGQYKVIIIDLECDLKLLIYFKIKLTNLFYK